MRDKEVDGQVSLIRDGHCDVLLFGGFVPREKGSYTKSGRVYKKRATQFFGILFLAWSPSA